MDIKNLIMMLAPAFKCGQFYVYEDDDMATFVRGMMAVIGHIGKEVGIDIDKVEISDVTYDRASVFLHVLYKESKEASDKDKENMSDESHEKRKKQITAMKLRHVELLKEFNEYRLMMKRPN